MAAVWHFLWIATYCCHRRLMTKSPKLLFRRRILCLPATEASEGYTLSNVYVPYGREAGPSGPYSVLSPTRTKTRPLIAC